MQVSVPYTASERVIAEKILGLFQKLYTRRMLIRLVGVKLSDLISGSLQIDLFNDMITDLNLSRAMDSIRLKHGTAAIVRGFSFERKTKEREKKRVCC